MATLGACGTHRHTWDEEFNLGTVSQSMEGKKLAYMLKFFFHWYIDILCYSLPTAPSLALYDDAKGNKRREQKGECGLPPLEKQLALKGTVSKVPGGPIELQGGVHSAGGSLL